jgi:predicted acyl esterase
MNALSQKIAGQVVDRMIGLPGPAKPFVLRRDVRVTMPDRVVLLGDHYRPAGQDGPMPAVLIRSPYGRAGAVGMLFAAPLARRGFQVFIQSTRGTFGSGGQFRPFLTEHDDGLATIAWLREQPWCDGRVSTAGGSYLGHTSDPLPGRLDLVGPVSARIHLRTEREHADLFVRVCDVDPKEVSRNVVDGIRRLSPQSVPAPDVQIGDDGILAVDVELYPAGYRMRAGHRIRVQVSGGAFPRFARNLGTGEPFGSATSGRRCSFGIYSDERHPSHILLPVLPAG